MTTNEPNANAPQNAPTAPLYSQLPYPGDGVVRTIVAKNLRRELGRHFPELARKPNLRIVDVGCGTGEATLGIAKFFPNATVVGIDINDASLAKANELKERARSSVRFQRADILGDLDRVRRELLPDQRGFDVAVSMGVLHHLPNPPRGFAAVRGLLDPQGAFFCSVYSRYGRWDDQGVRSLLDRTFPRGAFEAR